MMPFNMSENFGRLLRIDMADGPTNLHQVTKKFQKLLEQLIDSADKRKTLI
jgi:hypothetical protein